MNFFEATLTTADRQSTIITYQTAAATVADATKEIREMFPGVVVNGVHCTRSPFVA